jgi:hypothetical protein
MDLMRMVQIDVLEKPIETIKETCAMMGIAEKFDRMLPDLETFLEAEVAKGETRETRLTFEGLLYVKQILASRAKRPPLPTGCRSRSWPRDTAVALRTSERRYSRRPAERSGAGRRDRLSQFG